MKTLPYILPESLVITVAQPSTSSESTHTMWSTPNSIAAKARVTPKDFNPKGCYLDSMKGLVALLGGSRVHKWDARQFPLCFKPQETEQLSNEFTLTLQLWRICGLKCWDAS
eukprot:5199995-Amphidinium_carterae.1